MRKILFAVLLFFSIFSASSSFAGCVDSFGIGSKATALGGAVAATADDPFAVYYNPAGLSQIEGPVVAAGVHMIDPDLSIYRFKVEGSDPNLNQGADFSDTSDSLFVPHIGYAQAINDRISVGVAAYVPYGLDIEWNDNPLQNPAAYSFYHSYYLREAVTPSISYKVNEKLSLGFGVSLGKSKSGVERKLYYPSRPSDLNPSLPDEYLGSVPPQTATEQAWYALSTSYAHNGSNVDVELEDSFNYSFNVGVLYQPNEDWSLGLTYRGRTDAEFKGDVEVDGVYACDAKMDYDHPEQIQAGVRYNTDDKFSMELDVVWTRWSILDQQTTYFSPDLMTLIAAEKFDRDWDNTTQVRMGFEWTPTEQMVFRAGYFYDPSPIPDDTFDMMWPDADKKTYSIGMGYDFGRITVDGVIQYAIAEQKRYIGGESENLNHAYNSPSIDGIFQMAGVDNSNDNGAVSMEADGHLWGFGLTVSYEF